MTKKLQKDSKYALADADGDGIVTDEEMDRHATWIRLENEDKQADTQRLMAMVLHGVSICYRCSILLTSSNLHLDRMDAVPLQFYLHFLMWLQTGGSMRHLWRASASMLKQR